MAKEPIVYQSNPLVECRRDFSLIETRLFYIGLRDLVPRLTEKDTPWKNSYRDFPVTVIPPKDIIDLFGNDKYYATLHDICRDFAKKTVEIHSAKDNGYEVYPVFAMLKYDSVEGLTLAFNPFMVPWLLDLANKPFTKLPFEQVWALRTSNAIRIFELVLQYQNTKTHERTISIEDLKQYLGIELNSYKGRNDMFRQRVIDPSVKDINEKTSYKIESEPVKKGRKIVGFKFKLHLPTEIKKEKRKKQIENIGKIVADTVKTCSSESTEEEKLFQMTDEQAELGKRKYAELMARLKASE